MAYSPANKFAMCGDPFFCHRRFFNSKHDKTKVKSRDWSENVVELLSRGSPASVGTVALTVLCLCMCYIYICMRVTREIAHARAIRIRVPRSNRDIVKIYTNRERYCIDLYRAMDKCLVRFLQERRFKNANRVKTVFLYQIRNICTTRNSCKIKINFSVFYVYG